MPLFKKKQTKIERKYKASIFKGFLKTIIFLGITGGVLVSGYCFYLLQDIPTIKESMLRTDSSTNMYAKDNTLIYSSAVNKRKYIEYKDIPETYIDLLLATEDHQYFQHKGFSIRGMTGALVSTLKGNPRGGSGIEQQLIKLTAYSTSAADRTPKRKVQELFLSSQLYENFSKEQNLEFYVNKILLGEGSYGIQTISNVYFGKDLKDLNTSQLAIIAGLGQSPSYFNMYDNIEAVEKRRNEVLGRGLETNKLTKKEYDEAINTPIDEGLVPRRSQAQELDKVTARHNSFVTSALKQIDDLGYDLEKTPLQIYTTLDINAENEVKYVLDERKDLFQDDRHQAAVTVTDPTTGAVISEVGGRFSNEIGSLNRATQTNRSTGSSIKPILNYGPAIEYYNWETNKILDGSPYTYPGTNITAYDYGGEIHGNSEMKVALRNSYNPPAIRTLDAVGETRATSFLKGLGIETDQTLAGQTALGLDASTTQMASAMGTFGQGGVYRPTRYIDKIIFSDESEKKIRFDENQAMRESTAFIMTEMLKGVVSDKGTMPKGKINGVNQAAKTGTVGYPPVWNIPQSASMDVWAVGYTKSLSVAVWQGYDTPMEDNSYISQDFTLEHTGDVYKEILSKLSEDRDNSDWDMPNTVTHLGGKGLNANYVPNDTPLVDSTKSLDKPQFNTRENYDPWTKSLDKKDWKTKKPKIPTPPKDWKPKQWEKGLQEDREQFYKEHENDKKEAAIVD